MLEIKLSSEADTILLKIPHNDARKIVTKIDILAEYPFKLPSKQLTGYAPLRRIRVGDYRVIYYIDGNTLEIYMIGKRNDDEVYKKLRRKP